MRRDRTKSIIQALGIGWGLILGLGLILSALGASPVARASRLEAAPQQNGSSVAGIASNALECLAVGPTASGATSGVVRLTWRGRVEQARLVLTVSGADAPHTIKVNGRAVASIPVYPDGQPCRNGESFYLDIPPDVVAQGDNQIEITSDALPGDSWSAAQIRLEVLGAMTLEARDTVGPLAATGVASVSAIITFVNAYDGSSQPAMMQLPDGYTGATPIPLVVYVHGRNSRMEDGLDAYGAAANGKGWLLASPELHGSWDPDPACYDPGVVCDLEDERVTQGGNPGAYAYASLESQYDVIGTLSYMIQYYNVDAQRIYLTGDSMGGQAGVILAAKYPHLFAAMFDNKGPTDMTEWYDEQLAYYGSANQPQVRAMRKECHIGGIPKLPSENPFCYQRRSGINFASNYLHVPISITHSISDALVPIHHSFELRDAINGFGPDQLSQVYEDTSVSCSPDYHCYLPNPATVLNYLRQFTVNK
ncbi:MAG TPA: prolyl oligopeptidase family serine peptidase, partial [Anaerolineae bacterium]